MQNDWSRRPCLSICGPTNPSSCIIIFIPSPLYFFPPTYCVLTAFDLCNVLAVLFSGTDGGSIGSINHTSLILEIVVRSFLSISIVIDLYDSFSYFNT